MTKVWFYERFLIFCLLIVATLNMAIANEYVPGEVLVKFKKTNSKNVTSLLKSENAKLKEEIKLSQETLYLLKFHEKSSIEKIIERLLKREDVVYAEPNYILRIVKPVQEATLEKMLDSVSNIPLYTLDDPKFGQLWGLRNTGSNDPGGGEGVVGADIDSLRAWDVTTGDNTVKIAVIDTGIDYTHPDINRNMWVNVAEKDGVAGVDDDGNGFIDDIHGYDFANDDGDPRDGHGHGTHCAGTIGAVHNNSEGVAGVMDNVQLVGIKFLTDSGSGTTANAIKSIDYGVKIGVDLMSNSWGGGTFSNALEDAIKRASEAGIIFVAAAGNSSSDNDTRAHYPSNYDVENVISVASHTSRNLLSSFSCYGKRTVHLAAPGSNIVSTVINGGYKSYSGTSMATPHVSGALGLLLSHTGRLPHQEMRQRLVETTVYSSNYKNKTVSAGRLNAYNLVMDIRPERPWEPGEDDWNDYNLSEIFESRHPYLDNTVLSRTITVPGAKMIRLFVKKMELEKRYDYIEVKGKDGGAVENVSGTGENYASNYVAGDTLNLTFKSDRSVTKWGFIVEKVQVIYNIPE